VLGLAAPAQGAVVIVADGVNHHGWITLFPGASPSLTHLVVSERVDGELRELGEPARAPWRYTPEYGDLTGAVMKDAARWKCTRRTRTFVAVASDDAGARERSSFTLRTPSCANRFTLTTRPGHATVTDTWDQGGVATVCGPRSCRRVKVRWGRQSKTVRLRIYRGDRVTLTTSHQRLVQRVGRHRRGGATILLTGDSLMQSLDAVLGDRLARRADLVSDVHAGAALTSTFSVDWLALARQQVARWHPHATIVFLGTNDLGGTRTPDGRAVQCCGPDWAAEFERRARIAMRTYAQDGAGKVVWLTIPYARDRSRAPAAAAVNAALYRAAAHVPGASVLGIDEIFTPDGRYRASMRYEGRRLRVREPDGIHLSIPGARIAAVYVIDALERAGVLA
jgi:lysophospholipase L1-like esterase